MPVVDTADPTEPVAVEAVDSEEVRRWGDDLAGRPAALVLARAAERFPPIRFGTGFGPEGCVLLDIIGRHRLPIEVFTLDTGLLFPETYELWRRLEERYSLVIRAVRPPLPVDEQSALWGDHLWERDPDRCCALRKVAPLRLALSGARAWVTGIRREQTRDRASARLVEWDAHHGVVKVNPLAHWTSAEVWAHLREHRVPVNPLHERGYASIGCVPCTTPVRPGEDPRAGRWRGHAKTECGLHARRSAAVLSFTPQAESAAADTVTR